MGKQLQYRRSEFPTGRAFASSRNDLRTHARCVEIVKRSVQSALETVLAAYSSESLWENDRFVVGHRMNYLGGAQPGKWWSRIGGTGEGIRKVFYAKELDVEQRSITRKSASHEECAVERGNHDRDRAERIVTSGGCDFVPQRLD
ncbi:MAG TPA: hypothetical protein EYQ82_05465 [Dehalococcoidia bacterium]|nr:hypothetical protein [Dehalococcoidia bacterium]